MRFLCVFFKIQFSTISSFSRKNSNEWNRRAPISVNLHYNWNKKGWCQWNFFVFSLQQKWSSSGVKGSFGRFWGVKFHVKNAGSVQGRKKNCFGKSDRHEFVLSFRAARQLLSSYHCTIFLAAGAWHTVRVVNLMSWSSWPDVLSSAQDF